MNKLYQNKSLKTKCEFKKKKNLKIKLNKYLKLD